MRKRKVNIRKTVSERRIVFIRKLNFICLATGLTFVFMSTMFGTDTQRIYIEAQNLQKETREIVVKTESLKIQAQGLKNSNQMIQEAKDSNFVPADAIKILPEE